MKAKCPNFIFLMETKCKRNKVEYVRNKLGFDNSFVVDSRGLSGGLALILNSSSNACLESYSQNHISIAISREDDGQQFMVTGFYGNPNTALSDESWRMLNLLKLNDDRAWLCVGGVGFNEILHQHENFG